MLKLTSSLLQTLLLAALIPLTACGDGSLPTQLPQAALQIQNTQASRQLIIKFKLSMSTAALSEFNARYGFHTLRTLPEVNAQIVEVDPTVGLKLNQIIRYLQADPNVVYAEANGRISTAPMPIMTIKPILQN